MAYNSIGGGTGVSNPQDIHEEYSNVGAFPTTGESGVIYIAIDTNLLYRWTGSSYVEVSPASGISTATVTIFDDITSAGSGSIITTAERSKLSGIEAGAEVNPTASEIKTLYESNADTNAFTDADSTSLANILAYAPGETLYVDGANGDDNNVGSFVKPFATIQAAINATTSGGYIIKVQNNVYVENLDFTNRYNITVIADGVTSSQVTHINGTVNLVNAENIKFKNFHIYQGSTTPTITFGETAPVAPVAGSGRHYFENCTILNTQVGQKSISVTDGITEWIVFRSCDINGVIDLPALTSIGSSVTMLSCDNRGSSLNINSNQTFIAVDCEALGPITHQNGVLYLKDIHAMERDGSNNCVLSTAAFSASNLIYMEDVNTYDPTTNSYGNIVIPNTAFILNACSRGYSNDSLNETLRLSRGLRSIDIAYDNSASGLTATNIKAALDELAASTGSTPETSVALADGTVTPTNIGLQFVSGTHRAYDLEITVERGSLSQYFMIKGLDTSTGWQQFVEKIGDETGVSFTVHTDGNIRYTSTSTTVIPNIVYKYSTVGVYTP